MAKTEDELLAESLAEEQRQIQEYVDKTAAEKGLSAEERENFLNICRERVAAERAKWPQRLSEVPLPDPAAPWSDEECWFQYELALEDIGDMQSICFLQWATEMDKPNPDQALIQLWKDEEARLEAESRAMPRNEALIRQVQELYSPVIRYWNKLPSDWFGAPPIWYGVEHWQKTHAPEGDSPSEPSPCCPVAF